MLSKDTFTFLKGLKKNNDKRWFEKHRAEYEAAKEDVTELAGELITAISSFDSRLKGLEPKDTLFRIFRDVRFSNDKTPYKTHFGSVIGPGGRKCQGSFYYIHIEPGDSFIAGGLHGLPTPEITKVRNAFDEHGQKFAKIINAPAFKKAFGKLEGEKLKSAPRGFAKDHPYLELLKHKDIIAMHNFSDTDMLSKQLVKKAADLFKKVKPFNDFLNDALGVK